MKAPDTVSSAPLTLAVPLTSADFAALIEKLANLSRNHLLYFRIEVGRAVCEIFFAGDPQTYFDQTASKSSPLRRFYNEQRDALAAMGLSEQLLRQCILAYIVVADLPAEIVQQLVFSQVVELSRVGDTATRRVLAQATVDNGWTLQALKDAVLSVRAGRWIDGDPEKAGLQPIPPDAEDEPEPRKPQPGRVVSRFEKTNDTLDDLISQWEQVDVAELTELQTTRVRGAIAELKARIARLEGRLPE